jgi:ABC-type sugar transport system substrate-binding protein
VIRSRILSFLSLLIVASMLLAACGAGGATTAPPAGTGSGAAAAGLPPLAKKDKYKVGFAQTESNNPWRLAETESMRSSVEAKGWEFVYTDAGGSAAKQVADVESMIAAKVDVIFLAPREETPLAPVVVKAREAGIPVILLDRNVDQSIAQAGRDYVTFIGSNFVDEGSRAGEWLIKATGGKAKIIELEGTTGSSPANDRKQGFHDTIKDQPGMEVVASQTGNFTRNEGRQVMETLLQAHPDVTAVYAHNDEMALGAIAALEAAGKVPGKDVIIVSIDGEKDALQAIVDGKLGASVECNPRFGPTAIEIMQKYAAGEKIEGKIVNPDNFYDASNATEAVKTAY